MNRLRTALDWKAGLLLGLGSGMLVCLLALTRLTHFTRQAPMYLRLVVLAYLFYLPAAWLVVFRPPRGRGAVLGLIFILGLAIRLPLWTTEPTLSNDVWRYLWDGHLLDQGLNPYAAAVDSPLLDPYSIPLRARVDHSWMASPYPPVALLAFAGAWRLTPHDPLGMQFVFSTFDLAAAALLVLILGRIGVPRSRVLLYLWNPLIVIEFAHAGHVDSAMIFFVLLAFYLALSKRDSWSSIALGLGVLIKYLPMMLVPLFLRRWRWRGALILGATIGVGFVAFWGAGSGLSDPNATSGIFAALRIYNTLWRSNSGLNSILVEILSPLVQDPAALARWIGMVVVAGIALWLFGRTPAEDFERRPQALFGRAALLISVYLLFSATIFPWYLAWLLALLPMLPLRRCRTAQLFAIAWLYFSAALQFSYLFYLDPAAPAELPWVRRLEYGPLFGFLSLALLVWVWPRFKSLRAAHPGAASGDRWPAEP